MWARIPFFCNAKQNLMNDFNKLTFNKINIVHIWRYEEPFADVAVTKIEYSYRFFSLDDEIAEINIDIEDWISKCVVDVPSPTSTTSVFCSINEMIICMNNFSVWYMNIPFKNGRDFFSHLSFFPMPEQKKVNEIF